MSSAAARVAAPGSRMRRQLEARAVGLLRDAHAQLGIKLPAGGSVKGSLSDVGSKLNEVTWAALARLENLSETDEESIALSGLALRANDLEDELRRHVHARRIQRQAEMETGLSRLRRMRTSAELLDRVCHEVVRSCGFVRSMLSRVEGDVWYPWMVHYKGDPESGEEFLSWMRDREIKLDELTLEQALVAEKHAELILDAANDPRAYKPFVAVGHMTSYVAAPIMPAGRVVGFLHADHGATGREVNADDRNVLWAFAEGFGRIYERVVLFERIRAQHRLVQETFEIAEAITTSLARTEMELESDGVEAAAPDDLLGEGTAPPRSVDELLTAREREVVAMMVRGMSNAAIAERLVIKVGTVKSHVKHILRKLGAVNRAAAISKYLGVEARD